MKSILGATDHHTFSRRDLLRATLAFFVAGSIGFIGWARVTALGSLNVQMQQLGLSRASVRDLGLKLRRSVDQDTADLLLRQFEQVCNCLPPAEITVDTFRNFVQNDFAAGRCIQVHGVSFSHTEAALLLCMADEEVMS